MKPDEKFAKAITDALVDRIKKIELSNFEEPWFENKGKMPRNLDGTLYNGSNRLLLSLIDGDREIPVYITFPRAKKEGIRIIPGEKARPVRHVNFSAFHIDTNNRLSIDKYKVLPAAEKEEYNVVFTGRYYDVFHVDQTNMKKVKPELYKQLKKQVEMDQSRVQSRLQRTDSPLLAIVENQLWLTPIKLNTEKAAFYFPVKDEIHLPLREYYKSDDLFYSILLHEMSHSTGHESRLKRPILNMPGSPEYAREELVAELSSAIVGQQYNLSKQILEANAQYLKSWLDSIEKEPEFLNEVLGDVTKASNMIVENIEQVNKHSLEQTDMRADSITRQELSYNRLKKKYPDAVLLFRDGKSYKVYGQDAVTIDKILSPDKRPLEQISGAIKETRFSSEALEVIMSQLVEEGKRIAIADSYSLVNGEKTVSRLKPNSLQSSIIQEAEKLIGLNWKHKENSFSEEQPKKQEKNQGLKI